MCNALLVNVLTSLPRHQSCLLSQKNEYAKQYLVGTHLLIVFEITSMSISRFVIDSELTSNYYFYSIRASCLGTKGNFGSQKELPAANSRHCKLAPRTSIKIRQKESRWMTLSVTASKLGHKTSFTGFCVGKLHIDGGMQQLPVKLPSIC